MQVENLAEQLRQERDRIESIIASMGEGLLVIDKETNVTMINPAAEKLLQIKATDVIGKKWSDAVSTLKGKAKTPTPERSFAKALRTEKIIITNLDDDHYYYTKTGVTFPVVSITAPIKSKKENNLIGAVKVFRDATPEQESKKIIERKVEERTVQLREARDKISKLMACN